MSDAELTMEIGKLVIDIMMPLILLLIGLWIKRIGDRIERKTRHSQIEVEWRLGVFKDLAPKINSLFCYFTYSGEWREMSPDDAITAKRECDRIVHTNRFLWSQPFMDAYSNFIRVAFAEQQGPGRNLRLRANRDRHRENPDWEEEWADRFVDPENRVHRDDFKRAYDAVLAQAVIDLEIFGT